MADFVPETHPLRQWADTFPWAALVAAVDRTFAQRFPHPPRVDVPPVATRVVLALELLKHELPCSDEQICSRLRTDLAVMYACGIREVQVDRRPSAFCAARILAQFRSRLDEPLMEELLAIQAAAAMEEGLVSPAHLVVDTFPSEQGSQRVNDAATLYKAQKKSSRSSRPSPSSAPPRARRCKAQAQQLQQDLAKIMRRFGRQCRGMGKVFVRLVRQTETPLLETGEPVLALARAAQAHVHSAPQLSEDQRARLGHQLTAALEAASADRTQSRRLTQGKPLTHCKIVNAYDPTIAPICKGKSNCPTQFGRKPGIIAEPATGFVFALHLPVGNPSDASYVVPLVDKVQTGGRPGHDAAPPSHPLAGRRSGRQ